MNSENKITGETVVADKTYNIQDLYKIIQAQQSTINKMTSEVILYFMSISYNYLATPLCKL